MRSPLPLGLLLSLAALFAASAAAADSTSVARLGWMSGAWGGPAGRVMMEEVWSSPEGGAMVGVHKDTRGGRLVSYEFFRIVPDSVGRAVYLTSPNGAPATAFVAIEISDSRVVFENRSHDFPQRILYWRSHSDTLHARIEGSDRGLERSMSWAWARRR